jgi:DNA-binding Xre family transcriptional regulator
MRFSLVFVQFLGYDRVKATKTRHEKEGDLRTHYGKAIRGMRIARDLSATQLGAKCEPSMTGHQINYIEGQRSIQTRKLESVCKGLGVTPSDVYAFTETMRDAEPS